MPAHPQKPKPEPCPYPPGWEPFLAAIKSHLDDDTPRVVFADWLEENGDPERAEFIRLQCDHASGRQADAARADALLIANQRKWVRGLPKSLADNPNPARCIFRRGFVAEIALRGERWATDGPTITRLTPLENLTLENVVPALLKSPDAVGVPHLSIPCATSAIVEALAESPMLPALTALCLTPRWGTRVSQRSVRKLLANPTLTRLRRLHLASIPAGDAVAGALVAAPHITGLEELQMRWAEFGPAGAEALARWPGAANLRVFGIAPSDLGDEGLRHLIASPYLRNLVELDLRSCGLTTGAAFLLAAWEGLKSVRTLRLQGNPVFGARSIVAGSPFATNLSLDTEGQ